MVGSSKKHEPAYYLLICMDAVDSYDQKVFASDIAKMRLRYNAWPLYKRTGHVGNLKHGDRCLVYLGGTGPNRQSFIGEGTVRAICSVPYDWADGDGSLIMDPAVKLVRFSNTKTWRKPVCIRSHIDYLRFIKNKKTWGVHLMGGIRRIPAADYERICAASK